MHLIENYTESYERHVNGRMSSQLKKKSAALKQDEKNTWPGGFLGGEREKQVENREALATAFIKGTWAAQRGALILEKRQQHNGNWEENVKLWGKAVFGQILDFIFFSLNV